jgi:hypothetical protein
MATKNSNCPAEADRPAPNSQGLKRVKVLRTEAR